MVDGIVSAPGFIEIGSLGDGAGGVPLDYARTRARWAALPGGWMTEDEMLAAVRRVCGLADWDDATAALLSMGDFVEVRGPARKREYRRVPEPPAPVTVQQREEARVAAVAEAERERVEREFTAREAKTSAEMAPFFANQRTVHRELANEYTVPMVRALEGRIAQLEARLAQHGRPEVGVVGTPAPASSAAPAAQGSAEDPSDELTEGEVKRLLAEAEEPETASTVAQPASASSETAPVAGSSPSRLEQVRAFLFGPNVSQSEAEGLLEDAEEDE